MKAKLTMILAACLVSTMPVIAAEGTHTAFERGLLEEEGSQS